MRIMRMFSIMIMLATFGIIPSQDERVSCCSSSGQIKQIKLLTQGIKNSINAINDTVSEFDCTPAEITSILDNIAEMSSALDTITSIGISSCCSEVNQVESFVTAIESRIENLHLDCCDLVTESVAVTSTFDSLVDSIQSGPSCCSLVDRMLSSLEALESVVEEVDALVACATTPIFTSTTISVSGSYCLANTITAPLVITAGNVTLNLNGNAIIMDSASHGIHVTGPGNVILKNGFISADTTTPVTVNGVAILVETSHVIIKDIQVLGNFDGGRFDNPNSIIDGIDCVDLTDSTTIHDIFVDRVTVNRCVDGIAIDDTYNCTVKNSSFNNNLLVGITIAGPFNRIDNCEANNNLIEAGFGLFQGTTAGGNNLIINCATQGNPDGFLVNGFSLLTAGNALIDCTAQTNFIGFDVASDEQNLQLIKRCIATGNTNGFNNSFCSIIEYIANVAQDNSVANYDTPTNPTFNTPVDPTTIVDPLSYWLNLTI